MARRDLRSNALSALMGGAPTKPAQNVPPAPQADEKEEPPEQAEKPTAQPRAKAAAPEKPQTARASAPKWKPKSAAPEPVVEAAPDGYVGKSQYRRKRRGLVSKVAVHLSPDVARALRQAGAVGDENGSNMSEIVEALLVRAGYGG